MQRARRSASVRVIAAAEQQDGAFDGGRITEKRPIPFPSEGPAPAGLGPLFYWAAAEAQGAGHIPLHPHQAFEILTYVLAGTVHHRDTLGNDGAVGAGGVQLMQAGSGLAHEERTSGGGARFLQIWFEPDLAQARRRAPRYAQLAREELPVRDADGVRVRTLVGAGAPLSLVADALVRDVVVAPGCAHEQLLASGRSLALLVVAGRGELDGDAKAALEPGAFATVRADLDARVRVRAGDGELHLVVIEVPAAVDYPLYRDAR